MNESSLPPRDLTHKEWIDLLKHAAINAANEAKEKGVPITYLEGRKIVKIHPDGRKELIKELDSPRKRVTKKIFHLKDGKD